MTSFTSTRRKDTRLTCTESLKRDRCRVSGHVSLALAYACQRGGGHVLIFNRVSTGQGKVRERATCIKGKFGPLWSKKMKVVFHPFHPTGLLE